MRTVAVAVVAAIAGGFAIAHGQPGRRSDEDVWRGLGAVDPPAVRAFQARWAVVNPTPAMAQNIMLVDAVSGETWITCNSDGSVAWCGPIRRVQGHVNGSSR